jgi:hypothetical protein
MGPMGYYSIEAVGIRGSPHLMDAEVWKRYLEESLKALAKEAESQVRASLSVQSFKYTTGRIQRAIYWKQEGLSAEVGIDVRIAAHAWWVERGVKEHEMRYLIGAKRSIPLPFGPKNKTIYRIATEKWMGVPRTIEDAATGADIMTKGWIHPGYEGKFFFRKGIMKAMEIATQQNRGLVWRVLDLMGGSQ